LADSTPPIFAHPIAENPDSSQMPDTLVGPAPQHELISGMRQFIAEGLPKYDSKTSDQGADKASNPPTPGQSVPLLMEPFTVFDTRILDLEKPHENLLGTIEGTEPVYRRVGDRLTSELTFVDLAKASNWRPFSLEPPPAVSLRFTVSW
jgi:hypothetical protein